MNKTSAILQLSTSVRADGILIPKLQQALLVSGNFAEPTRIDELKKNNQNLVTMKYILSIFFSCVFSYSFGQNKLDLSNLFIKISKEVVNTKEIGANKNIILFSENKQNSIKFLIEEFTNTKSTKVYSDCLKRNINLGELAIIIVDKLEPMPYLKLTAIKNAEEKSKQYCKSGNVIEFYLNQISMEGGGIKDFQYFYKRMYLKPQND